MKILVIGGTGFIGHAVVNTLLRNEQEVYVLHRGQQPIPAQKGLSIIQANRQDLSAFKQEVRAIEPEVIIDIIPYFPEDIWSLFQAFDMKPPRIVAISSGDVYLAYDIFRDVVRESPQPALLKESAALRQKLFPYRGDIRLVDDETQFRQYNYDKILIEQLLRRPNEAHTILRLPMIYGRKDHRLRFSFFIKHFIDKRPFVFIQNSFKNWVWTKSHVENAAKAIYLAATQEEAIGKIYNVGEDYQDTEFAWIERIAKQMDWKGEFIFVDDEQLPETLKVPGNFSQHLALDSSKIRNELNYQDTLQIEESIRDTIEYVSQELAKSNTKYTQEYNAADMLYKQLKKGE